MSNSIPLPASLNAPFDEIAERGTVVVLPGKGGRFQAALRAAASERSFEIVEVDAGVAGMSPGGVAARLGAGLLGGPGGSVDESIARDAVGDGAGALAAWARVRTGEVSGEPGDLDFEAGLRSEAAVRAGVLAALGELEPRVVLLRRPEELDDASARALRALFLGGPAAGWILALPAVEVGAAAALVSRMTEVEGDERVPRARLVAIRLPERKRPRASAPAEDAPSVPAEDDGPSLPSKGTSVELHAILSAAPGGVPVDVVGSGALSSYRGRAPRGSWEDLQGLYDAKLAAAPGGVLRLRTRRPAPPVVRRADARALLDAVAEVLDGDDATRGRVLAGLAAAGGRDAARYAAEAAEQALSRGEAEAAERLLAGAGPAVGSLLRARAARLRDDPTAALRHAEAAAGSADPAERLAGLLEAAFATWASGRPGPARTRFAAAAAEAEAAGDDHALGTARFVEGLILEQMGDWVGAARVLGDSAKTFDGADDDVRSARAFARRAVAMAKAGAPDRAVRELRLAMDRAPDLDDPHPAALDVRILIGVVFREAGSRDKARQALGVAAEKARRHAAPDRAAEATLLAARFHLEAMPVRGAERGEAMRDGREAAEAAIVLARGSGLVEVEAEAEAVLGELAWRSEDFEGAGVSLDRQALLWARARRPAKEVDVAIRRGRLAGRREDWETAFQAGVAALTLASKRRLKEQVAQAQLLRGEALQNLERGSEALEAFAEAQRVFTSLGEGFEAQASAAEQRARQAISAGR